MSGQRLSGSTVIPVAEMARGMLPAIFPHLSSEEVRALRDGLPMPSEASYLAAATDQLIGDGVIAALSRGVPKVSCVLLFGPPQYAADLLKSARRSVNQFVVQSYPNKQLVIINTTSTPVTTVSHPEIVEVSEPAAPLWVLRNRGLALCTGEYVKPCWDCDDLFNRHLLSYQMLHRYGDRAVLLQRQLRLDLNRNTVRFVVDPRGVPNTMIVPRVAGQEFAEGAVGEDRDFRDRYWLDHAVAVGNHDYPASLLSIAVHHGKNMTAPAAFLPENLDTAVRTGLSYPELNYLKAVMSFCGVGVHFETPAVSVGVIGDDNTDAQLRGDRRAA